MAILRYAVVQGSLVTNVILAEEGHPPAAGCQLVLLEGNDVGSVCPGCTYENGVFSPPAPDPELVRIQEIAQELKNDSVVQQLKTMTKSEFDTWWAANVTNAAQAITVLKKLCNIVRVKF